MKKLYQAAAFIFTMIFVSNICSQWIIVSSGGTKDLNSITNYSATLLAVGDSGLVKKSVNLGSTWQTLPFISTVNLTGVFITGVNDAYICGEQNMIYKTSNNGSNWFAQTTFWPPLKISPDLFKEGSKFPRANKVHTTLEKNVKLPKHESATF